MENLWLKIKIWTKIILFSIVVVYLGIFIYNNSDQPLTIWIWFGKEFRTSALEMIPAMLLAGVFGTVVVRMGVRAVKQIRELQERNAATKMQKDLADIKTKAGMLQTKPATPTPADAVSKGS